MTLTTKKDLRSGTPVWMAYPRRIASAKRITRDLKTDVLVVGAGISGALIAYALARDGHKVVVVDRRGPVMSSTPVLIALPDRRSPKMRSWRLKRRARPAGS